MVRLSEVKDVIICPRGIEGTITHIIAVNDNFINIAYELDSIVLLGAPRENTDYRPFNIDVQVARFLMDKETKGVQTFNRAKAKLSKAINAQSVITVKGSKCTISNVAYNGIEYFLIYYFLCKHYPMALELNNNFEYIAEAFAMVDTILGSSRLTAVELKSFAEFVTAYQNVVHPIGSKVQSITRAQIMNSADLKQPLWRTMYIHRIIRNIPLLVRKHYFRPAVDWTFVRCATKYFFSSQELKKRAQIGDNIDFLGVTANRQIRAIQGVADATTDVKDDNDISEVKRIAISLQKAVFEMDYTLGDLAQITFFEDIGSPFYDEVKRTAEQTLVTPIFNDHEQLKHIVLQYLYALFLLAQNGIIHNDARLQNILLTPAELSEQRRTRIYKLSNGTYVEMGPPLVNLTLIDFDNAMLSNHHHDFSQSAKQIQQEMMIALKAQGKKMVDDYDIMFNCYALYDLIKFCLLLRVHIDFIEEEFSHLNRTNTTSVHKMNREWLDKVIKTAVPILHKLFPPANAAGDFPFEPKDTHGSIQWMIETIYPVKTDTTVPTDPIIQTPEFISSRRKHADTLKLQFVAEYASSITGGVENVLSTLACNIHN